jgi:hypothetical protein
MKMSEPFHPNAAGAALMSDVITNQLAEQLRLEHPDPSGDRVYDTGNITITNSPAPGTSCRGRPDRSTPAPASAPPVIPPGTPMRQPYQPSVALPPLAPPLFRYQPPTAPPPPESFMGS